MINGYGGSLMKKYLILFFMSISIILIILGSGYTRIDNINTVKGIRLSGTSAEKVIDVSGTVRAADSHECIAKGSGIVQYLFVKEGDYVNEGDAVLAAAEIQDDNDFTEIISSVLSEGSGIESLLGSNIEAVIYKADVSGRIYGINTDIDGVYTKGSTLFSVSGDNNNYEIISDVSENIIEQLHEGQPVKITVNALSVPFDGYIKEIGDCASRTGNSLNRATTVKVTIAIENRADSLKRGYTANCSVITAQKENVLIAPYPSIETDESGETFVYISENNTCRKRSVICGEEYSEGKEILSGLTEGDIVVCDISAIDEEKENIIGEVMINEK